MTEVADKRVSRRKFLKSGTLAAGAAAGALAMPSVVTAQAPLVIKMQSSWTASDIFHGWPASTSTRVEAMSGGRLKIDLTPAGAIVGAFQVMDGVQ